MVRVSCRNLDLESDHDHSPARHPHDTKESAVSFIPRAWPPGLAYSPGSHRWEHYPCSPNGAPEWALNLDSLIRSMKLSKSNDRRIRATVFTALRRAERGELTVVVKNSSPASCHLGIRTGGQRCDSRLSSTAASSEHLKATQEPSIKLNNLDSP